MGLNENNYSDGEYWDLTKKPDKFKSQTIMPNASQTTMTNPAEFTYKHTIE